MKTLVLLSVFLRRCLATAGVLVFTLSAFPQGSTATGTIEGRVFDAARGEYLETARVTVEGTTGEAFTDSAGHYRLTGVPAGTARVKVFFTGLLSQTEAVKVTAGQTAVLDISLAAARAKPAAVGDTVKLSAFVVATSKEMDGAAIAINTQRFASNIMNVVAADEFGTIVDGTPGEALKFLPGVAMSYDAGEPRTISLEGAPAANVPITIGGFQLASTAGNGTSRVQTLDQVSINSIARIEVNQSPTPESPGTALSGTVNMVPRSAFERSRPALNYSAFMMFKDAERSWSKQPGPLDRPMRRITPGFNFSAVVPVNKRFGFTVSGNHTDQYSFENVITSAWRGVGATTTHAPTTPPPATGNYFPDTTPDNPYLTDVQVRDSTRGDRNRSFGLTADWKVAPNDTLSFSFQYTFRGVKHNNRTMSFFVNRVLPGQWGPTFTRGAPIAPGSTAGGEIRIQGNAQDWLGNTRSLSLIWRHQGPVWKAEAGAGFSLAGLHVRDIDKGWFGATQARRTGVVVSFADIYYLRPNTITVTDPSGNPVDPYDLGSYTLVNADDHPRDSYDDKRSALVNLRRDFTVRGVPVTLKGGLEVNSNTRNLRGTTTPFNFVGRDGIASNIALNPRLGDDSAAVVLDGPFSQRFGPYGFPKIPWIDNVAYYNLYKAHPEYFQPLTSNANANSIYRSHVGISKFAQEIVSAAYLRGDLAFFNRRLQFVGGARAEQTNVTGEGPLTDPTLNFQRNANGQFIRGDNGRPLTIAPTGDTLGISRLTYLDRGQHMKKEYLRILPNLNGSLRLRDDLILRGAVYQSLGRQSFGQYTSGLTLPDVSVGPTSGNRISVNNAGIKAWTGNTMKLRLEYYFERIGQVSVGAFRRDFKNFFGSTVFAATPEFLELYDLDPSVYEGYDVSTNYNLPGRLRMEGLDFNYKQALTFLPDWGRGVQIHANATALRATGVAAANFSGFVPRTASWGFSFSRPKYGLKMNWNYRGRRRHENVTGRGIAPGTYRWDSRFLFVDLNAEYYVSKRVGFFVNVRNLTATFDDDKFFNEFTPRGTGFRTRADYGASWTIGIKGSL